MDPLAHRVAAKYLARFATDEVDAGRLTFPREFHLPKEIRDKPANVDPEGTDAAIWTYEVTSPDGKVAPYAVAFVGKQSKPLWHFRFRNEAERQHRIDETIKSRKALMEMKQKALQERKEFVHGISKGDIYVSSWGYDQTNVDFYEVVDIKGKMVVVREIASKASHSERGADYVVADPGKFTGPPMLVRPSPGGGFKVGHHYASKWDGKPEYVTPFGMGH